MIVRVSALLASLSPSSACGGWLPALSHPADLAPIALWIGEPRHAPPQFLIRCADVRPLAPWANIRPRWDCRSFASSCAVASSAASSCPQVASIRQRCCSRERHVKHSSVSCRPASIRRGVSWYSCRTRSIRSHEGAALLAGAEPTPDTLPENRYLPDLQAVPAAAWARCQLLFLCSPGNPTGAVMSQEYLTDALRDRRSLRFHHRGGQSATRTFISMKHRLLRASYRRHGRPRRSRFERCVAFHSLSKRSSVPGLRSGFVVGDPQIMQQYHLYRTYHGAAVGTTYRWRA